MDLKKGSSETTAKNCGGHSYLNCLDLTLTSFSFLEDLYLFEFLASGIQKNRSCLNI
jgi:hypothetical protein